MPRAARRTTRTGLVLLVAVLALLGLSRPALAGTDPTGSADEIAYDPWDDSAVMGDTSPYAGGYIPNSRRFEADPGIRVADVLPAGVNLLQYAPPMGDQGSIGACVAWTISHNIMGY